MGRSRRCMSATLACLAMIGPLAAAGCSPDPTSGQGFTLPPGDVAAGERAFTRLGCNSCHEVAGRNDLRDDSAPQMSVPLGGPTRRVSTYGELVTSIINPSHRIAEGAGKDVTDPAGGSRMRDYNDLMTISELADLVAFLQAQYDLELPRPTPYPPYYPEP